MGYEEIYEIKVKDNNDVEQGGNTESVSEQILLTNSQKRNELQYNNQPELDEELEDKEIKQIGLNPIPEKRDEMEEIRDKRDEGIGFSKRMVFCITNLFEQIMIFTTNLFRKRLGCRG